MRTLAELVEHYNKCATAVQEASVAYQEERDPEKATELRTALDTAVVEAKNAKEEVTKRQEMDDLRAGFTPIAAGETDENEKRDKSGRIIVREPDMYQKRDQAKSFVADLYWSALKPSANPEATKRINDHQAFEISRREREQRAIVTTTLGGILPPQYMLNLVAKASRNGRVFADQINHQDMPDNGMSIIVPRLTQGLAVGVQATENTTVTTQDPIEVDLTIPVRTLAGYSPVSRQTLERNAYGDSLLMEDLIARYWALVDTQAINGSGAAGQMLGLLNTAGTATSSTATATVAALYPKIADLIQQINSNTGGLGYVADKIFMHPRRWGFFSAALDTANRPLIVPAGVNGQAFNPIGSGQEPGYGMLMGYMHGLPIFSDANIPTNLGGGTNEDRIIVAASNIVHLWERPEDPITLSFEQTTGTALQVNLVCYGYAGFTAGRYPGAVGILSGAALVPPTF